jgi:hypothetical protein
MMCIVASIPFKEAIYMRRLYFLIPTVDSAKDIVDELLLARIEQRHIHIAAADHHALLEANLPEAGLLQESDFVPAVERGLAIGGATGIVAGIAAVALPGVGLAWASGMIGISAPSSRLKEFEAAISEGQLLMMVDVPKDQVEDVTVLIKKHHPEVEVEGTEPVIPAFP